MVWAITPYHSDGIVDVKLFRTKGALTRHIYKHYGDNVYISELDLMIYENMSDEARAEPLAVFEQKQVQ